MPSHWNYTARIRLRARFNSHCYFMIICCHGDLSAGWFQSYNQVINPCNSLQFNVLFWYCQESFVSTGSLKCLDDYYNHLRTVAMNRFSDIESSSMDLIIFLLFCHSSRRISKMHIKFVLMYLVLKSLKSSSFTSLTRLIIIITCQNRERFYLDSPIYTFTHIFTINSAQWISILSFSLNFFGLILSD